MAGDAGEINALLGHGTDFSGKLTFEGTVRIDGRFQGEIFTHDVLIIGDGAEVRAEIDAGTLIIRGGVVVGDIRARDLVEIHAPGRLLGNIVSPSLFIGKGVVFDGRCQMRDGDDEACERVEGPAPALVEATAVDDAPVAPARTTPPAAPPAPVAAPVPVVPAQAWPPVQVVPPVSVQKRR